MLKTILYFHFSECECNNEGTESCNKKIGSCNCIPNVTGNKCDTCADGFYGPVSNCQGKSLMIETILFVHLIHNCLYLQRVIVMQMELNCVTRKMGNAFANLMWLEPNVISAKMTSMDLSQIVKVSFLKNNEPILFKKQQRNYSSFSQHVNVMQKGLNHAIRNLDNVSANLTWLE